MSLIKRLINKYFPSRLAWRGAAIGVILATLLFSVLSTVDLLENDVSIVDASFYFFLGSLLIALVGTILVFLWLALLGVPNEYKWALACFVFAIYYFFLPQINSNGMVLIALWMLLSFSLTFGAIWVLISHFKHKNQNSLLGPLICLFLGLLGMGSLFAWISTDHTHAPLKDWNDPDHLPPQLDLMDPSLKGTFSFNTLTYGSGKDTRRKEYGTHADVVTPEIDGSPFIEGWDGIDGWLRSNYWGFDAKHLPLNAKVRLPEGQGPFPLVMLVHGNHEMATASEIGYDYLSALFASKGLIVVSIDENFLNNSWVDIFGNLDTYAARGWLILEHLALWRRWNETEGHLFYQKVDMHNIALIGHSRGGEAIVTAAILNRLPYYPENGNVSLNYYFDIKSLAAISPVDSQYTIADLKMTLKNIDYFVLYGSDDADVRAFEGMGQYFRTTFDDGHYHFKSSQYVVGANHGQFNDQWGDDDLSLPKHILLTNKFLTKQSQQRIAQVFLSAFIETSLLHNREYLPLFRDPRKGRQWLPQTTYFNMFADSNFQYLQNRYKSFNISLGESGIRLRGKNLSVWEMWPIKLRNGDLIDAGILLGWKASKVDVQQYIIMFPTNYPKVSSESILTLTLCNRKENQEIPIDFTIELMDDKGMISSTLLSDNRYLPPLVHTTPMKALWLDPLALRSECLFQTFEFPLVNFEKNNQDFQAKNLKSIKLIFNKTAEGTILIDNIAITTSPSGASNKE